jgi:hypothetical protein
MARVAVKATRRQNGKGVAYAFHPPGYARFYFLIYTFSKILFTLCIEKLARHVLIIYPIIFR